MNERLKDLLAKPTTTGTNRYLAALNRCKVYGSQADIDILEQACITADIFDETHKLKK